MDIGLETEVDECEICGQSRAACNFAGKCSSEILEPDTKSEDEFKYEMIGLEEHLDKRINLGDLDSLYYNEAYISLLKRRVKQLITEKNFYLTKCENYEN